jgi:hypothetical protein
MRRHLRPSPAMVVAFIALFVAIGGSSYAVTRLPTNSVGGKQLRKNAVTGAKVKNGSLTAADIKVRSLTGVASAATATNAANAVHATAAAGLDRVQYVSAPGSVAPGTPDPADPTAVIATIGAATAGCPPGTLAVGGGVGVDDRTNTAVVDTFPDRAGQAWTARVDNADLASSHSFTVIAVCVAAAAAG